MALDPMAQAIVDIGARSLANDEALLRLAQKLAERYTEQIQTIEKLTQDIDVLKAEVDFLKHTKMDDPSYNPMEE